MPEAPCGSERAVRASWRMEIQPEELATTLRLLAGLPRPPEDVGPAMRLAAAGRELIYQRGLLERVGELVEGGELPMGSAEEARVIVDARQSVGELVGRIEEHLGAFPAEEPWREGGARETYLVEVAPERQQDARWVVELAHQVSDAPEPVELVGRMMLRAVAEDLREVGRFLAEVAAASEEGELRNLVGELDAGCIELAAAIGGALPEEPVSRREDGAAGVEG